MGSTTGMTGRNKKIINAVVMKPGEPPSGRFMSASSTRQPALTITTPIRVTQIGSPAYDEIMNTVPTTKAKPARANA